MRDCENCKNHTDKGCTKWKCEFWPTTKNDLGVDAVSRKDVLDAIDVKAWEFCDYLISKGRNDEQKPVSHFADNLRECVREELPSVTPQEPRWIPTSERLPENKTYVLVTIGIPGRQPHARSGWYQDGFFHNDNGDCWRATDIEVKAWMPLPKPYEPQESEEV